LLVDKENAVLPVVFGLHVVVDVFDGYSVVTGSETINIPDLFHRQPDHLTFLFCGVAGFVCIVC